MELNELTAISSVDGRYRKNTSLLSEYFSEYGFIKLRVEIEIEYLITLLPQIGKKITKEEEKILRKLWQEFSPVDAQKVKDHEKTIKHDIKAIEYFIQEKLGENFKNLISFINFGLTSYDVNIPAYALALKETNEKILLPTLSDLEKKLVSFALENAGLVMLGRTHGQPAVPTTLGKEIKNFTMRIKKTLNRINNYKFEAKLNGAVGNFNAMVAAYPKTNWVKFSDNFLKSLGLVPNHFTTQILPYDNWLEYFLQLKLLNNILIGFCQDVWRYISDDFFIQIPTAGEVGSSTMPQKVNPIDFENAEGNLGVANAFFEFYERKLPVSRLQRDLSDSTVKRTFGVALAHSLFAYQNILAGLGKIIPNKVKMEEDLENHWECLAEGIQTILRVEGVPDAYEKLKELTRGKKITKEILQKFITGLKVSKQAKEKLLKLSPQSYIGLAKELACLPP